MPHCYIKTRSSPREAVPHVAQCVSEVGGPGEIRLLATDGRTLYSLIEYETMELAADHLGEIAHCLEQKGHVIREAAVLKDFDLAEATA